MWNLNISPYRSNITSSNTIPLKHQFVPTRHLSQLLPAPFSVRSSAKKTTWFNRLSQNWQAKVNMLSHHPPSPSWNSIRTENTLTHHLTPAVWLFGKKLNKLNIKLHSGCLATTTTTPTHFLSPSSVKLKTRFWLVTSAEEILLHQTHTTICSCVV